MNRKVLLLDVAGLFFMILIAVFGSRTGKPPERNGIAFTTLPEDGKTAFENYLALYARGFYGILYPNVISFSEEELEYLVFEADHASEWRRDVKSAWCVLTTRRIVLKNGTDTLEFVVYVTNQDTWGAIGSKSEYEAAGCG